MKKPTSQRQRKRKSISPASAYDSCAEVLAHLDFECERTGYELSANQRTIFYDLRDGPKEAAIAMLHSWWCYDLEKLLAQMPHTFHPKPRIYLSVWTNQRGRLIVSWRTTHPVEERQRGSDFRCHPCVATEDRLIEIREFGSATVFHWPPAAAAHLSSFSYPPESDNQIMSNALLLQAASAQLKELKKRLSFCFAVTMLDDIYFEWQPDTDRKWEARGTIKFWEIKNVAAHEKAEALKILDTFEKDYSCTLASFIEVTFGPDRKPKSGPLPSPHTKIDRSSRRLKALGHTQLTTSVVQRYADLLTKYRPELLPEIPGSSNVVPFSSKK